jgi:hypothetical protein
MGIALLAWWLLSLWCTGPAATLDLSAWAPVCRMVVR